MQQQVPDPLELAARQQAETISKLATARYQLGDHMALHVLEALEVWCQLAEQMGSPNQVVARQQLQRWLAVIDRAKAINAGIMIPKAKLRGGNGRA